ncbi:protein kinase domain-containing protein [Streptomyces rugosispiralis]|uniref:Protein kinase n=1 Tax=Streptomyces rugosispiralis TaxID=2967341 RepID=A0ABT1V9B8_9ACTN|nr:protein kinase [Streptomyces rugosispiralis]MCQ8193379.1 protein kinase [Streptomyces rugosispiralis]
MEEYAGRVLADRYRLPLPPADEYELVETRAFDTYSGQEVHLRQIPLPEVVEAEVVGDDARWGGGPSGRNGTFAGAGRTARGGGDPAVRRAIAAATSAAQIPDHPRLGQVFHVFAEAGSLWIVSELVSGRPLAALLAEGTLSPHRAAEVANDVLTALRALHAHGWVHRNITARTVLLCDDGRAMLTGLAAGAAEEALCGYDPVPAAASSPAPDAVSAAEDGPSADGPSADVPASLPPGSSGSGDHPDSAERGPAAAQGLAARGDEGRAAIPGARTAEGGEARPHGGPRYHDQGAGGDFLPPGRPYGGHEPAGAVRPDEPAGAARPDADGREHGGQGRSPGLPEPRSPYGDHAVLEASSGPDANGSAGPGAGGPGAGGPAGPGAGGPVRSRPGGPVYRDQVTLGPGAGGPMAPYRDQAAAGGLPGPRRAGQPGQPGDREEARGGVGADAPNAAARAARASAIAAYAAGARAAARANVDAATRSPHAPDPAPTPAPEPDPEPVTGGARWPGQPEAAENAHPSDAQPSASEGPSAPEGGSWDSGGATGGGPATALAAERARQARIVVVGAVTERWAPEQAGPVHENWRLAPPVGPAADLWALGALLFRAVQGHAPYPEESAAELVQMVCGEAPAYAEECGPLRPVVESLMRQDPTERPDFEELRGWLRSLIRSAPEPDVGISTVTVPSLGSGGTSDPRRLPIVRRRGWLVRRGRGRRPAAAPDAPVGHARHRRDKREKRETRESRETRQAPPAPTTQRKPRKLGRMLLLLILLGLAAAVLYATMFMPRSKDDGGQGRTGSAGAPSAAPNDPADGDKSGGDKGDGNQGEAGKPAGSGDQEPQSTDPAGLAKGFAVRKDPKGFKVAVHDGWTRRGENGRGQIRYIGGDFELVVVAGRDKMSEFGGDPMAYQQDREAELSAFRGSSWASSSGLRRIDVGRTAMAEGAFTWRDSSGRNVYARNLAMLIDGRYHVVLVIGPSDERRAVNQYFEQATATYSTTNG